jgi:hypothetical protein
MITRRQLNTFIMMMSNDTLNSLLVREARWLKKSKEKSKEDDRELRYDLKRAEAMSKEIAQIASTGGVRLRV